MSAIALIFRRDGGSPNQTILTKMMDAMKHWGLGGACKLAVERVGLGILGAFATECETGLPIDQPNFVLAMVGRLDNKDELGRMLGTGANGELGENHSAVGMVALAYQKWGTECFAKLLGEFAIVLYDKEEHCLYCVRDPLGDRPLYYHLHRDYMLVASEEQALQQHSAVSATLNETGVAHFFAGKPLPSGHTIFTDVQALPPATYMQVTPTHHQLICYWQPDPTPIFYRHADEYVEEFRYLLQESIRCRLSEMPALLMSGGLDSTTLAALLTHDLQVDPLTTVSWVYDQLKTPDEGAYIDACVQHLPLNPFLLNGDSAWALAQPHSWGMDANFPFRDAFERLNERAYGATAQAGHRVLLTGLFGDHLYVGMENWLWDWLRRGEWGQAWREWQVLRKNAGIHQALFGSSTRRVAGELLNRIPGGRKMHPLKRQTPPRLTQFARNCLVPPDMAPVGFRPDQYQALFSETNSRLIQTQARAALSFGVALRHPYRDRRLVEWALRVPAFLFYQKGWTKYVARSATQGILPDKVRWRTKPSSFIELVWLGLADKEAEFAFGLLANPNNGWSQYVNGDFLPLDSLAQWRSRIPQMTEGELTTLWWCICFELWRRSQYNGY